MKISLKIILFLATLFCLQFNSFAQWTNGQAAVRVAGASDYTSVGSLYGTGIAIDVTNQKMYISDMCDNTVKRYPLTTGSLAASPVAEATFGTSATAGTSQTLLKSPSGLGVDNTGRLFIVDGGNHRVVYINSANSASSGASFSGVLGQANYTSGSANSGGSAANNTFNFAISSPSGIFSCTPTSYAGGYIAVASTNAIFVSDPGNNRVLRFDAPSTTSTAAAVIGQTTMSGTSSATSQSTLYTPMGVAINGTTLYIADMNNNRVVRYNSATTLSTGTNNASGVYGATSWAAPGSGGRSATLLDLPINVAVDGGGRLYINDSNNGRTVYINSASTKDGSGGTAVSFNGVIGQANLTAYSGSVSSSSFWAGVTGIAVNTTNNRLYVGNSGYGRMMQFNASSPLPVNIISFKINKLEDNQSELVWETSSEINNDRFEVESSHDGISFVKIGTVKGFGNSNSVIEYRFILPTVNNHSYFRLKQIDKDSTFSYSNIINFSKNEDLHITIYPNPDVYNTLYYELSSNILQSDYANISVIDINGISHYSSNITLSTGEIDVSHLPSGMYFIKLILDEEVYISKFNKM